MGIWDSYEARLGAVGNQTDHPRRIQAHDHLSSRIDRMITSSLSYQRVKIDETERSFAIVDTNKFDTKKIYSMPGEDIPHGSLIEWGDAIWLVTERNYDNKPYASGKMRQCNYKLKWIDDSGSIISKWCIVEDGTKYLIGERSEDIITIGDARMAVTLGKDKDTSRLSRGKRFLIDDLDSPEVLAFEITKPNKFFSVYNGRGVFRFILGEVNLTDNDNKELRIADYYNWMPKTPVVKPDTKVESTFEEIVDSAVKEKENMPEKIEERKVWL